MGLGTTPAAGSFVETLEDIVENLEQGRAEHIRLRIVGEPIPLPQFLSGNLLLVAQEAIHNALVHADCGQIDVVVTFDTGRSEVELVVTDDGQGFVPGRQTGPTKGHFGIVGMEERIARIGGTLTLDSAPERGTTIQARVRRRDYDAGLEGEERNRPALGQRGSTSLVDGSSPLAPSVSRDTVPALVRDPANAADRRQPSPLGSSQ